MDFASFRQGGPGVRAGLSAAFVVAVDDVAYILLIAQQHNGMGGRVVFVATLLAATAALAVTGVRSQRGPAYRTVALSIASTVCLVIGVLGAFSIGLPLLVAAGLAIYALSRAPVTPRAIIAGVVIGIAALFLGFGVTAS